MKTVTIMVLRIEQYSRGEGILIIIITVYSPISNV